MASPLYQILEWTKLHGEVKVLDRMRVYLLAVALRENLRFDQIKPETTCSDDALKMIRELASDLVGKPCPF
jgi:hypothetical protein